MIYRTFTFDGENSETHGIYVTGVSVYNAPVPVYDMITIPGRNGDLAMSGNRYANIEITYKCGAFADDQAGFADIMADVREWLGSRKGYKVLEDDYNSGEYRLAVFRSGLEVDPAAYWQAGEFEIVFDCKPQRFLASGDTAVSFSADGTITNPTLFTARPIITVTGTGELTIGDTVITIGGTSNTVIDCEMMECYDGTDSKNGDVSFSGYDFPILEPGANTIELGTGITAVSIVPKWWRL